MPGPTPNYTWLHQQRFDDAALQAAYEARTAPQLLDAYGIGPDTAAGILIVAGDNPERIHSEAAFAKLAGINPIPIDSGMTSGRHRLNRGGHRQLNAATYRTVIVRMNSTNPPSPT